MRLRTQFIIQVALAAILGLGALSSLNWAASAARQTANAQQRARIAAREVSGLLALTQEYVLFREERAEQQWHKRFEVLSRALDAGDGSSDHPDQVPVSLRGELQALPELFDALVRVSRQDSAGRQPSFQQNAFLTKQRELVIDRLTAETQAIAETAFEWEARLTAERAASEHTLSLLAVALPAMLAVLFTGSAALLGRRTLRSLNALQSAMNQVAEGDLDVRCHSTARDEVGDLARRFDHMTAELQSRTNALRESESWLRTITDNLPAWVGYVDQQERYRFANATHSAVHGRAPADMLGRTVRELRSQEMYAGIADKVRAALDGQTVRFEFDDQVNGRVQHRESMLIPDHADDGTVRGFYFMSFDITERKAHQALIEASLHEKDVLLREIHHRVKNNMQVVSSLLQLQSRHVDDMQARALFVESQSRIRSMALVHEMLYQTSDLARLDFADYARKLAAILMSSQGEQGRRANIEVQAEGPVELDIDRAIPAGLVLNELVSNSLKHAFPSGRTGQITIRLTRDPAGQLALDVRDDGVGPPPGFDPVSRTTLGLKLVRILAKQLDATLAFEHEQGFACTLTLRQANPAAPPAPGAADTPETH